VRLSLAEGLGAEVGAGKPEAFRHVRRQSRKNDEEGWAADPSL